MVVTVSPFVTIQSISTNGGVCVPEIRLILSLTISPDGRSTPLSIRACCMVSSLFYGWKNPALLYKTPCDKFLHLME